ncbi:hypothetical protein M3484_10375 [Pseudomonas sp. GX19020]|uniref:hypothetical protein n=1 Tax=Pseudomonas sp. GX19020 TaxID=2942277 RepID=UPI002018BD9B|nr:hypothetical protein [Pseudomonas sp. GX19020]MCL4066977.1 hypothetical protein [Pseudomonas sp. GX19020]
MFRNFTLAGIALMVSLAPGQAAEVVGEAGGWEIYRDANMGGGCYMMSAFEDGSIVQVGFDLKEDAAFMAVFNSDWTDISDGKAYPMTIDLDGQEWEADGHGVSDHEIGGIIVLIENEEFITDLALKNTLSLSNSDGEVALLDLTGTRDAVIATADCLSSN